MFVVGTFMDSLGDAGAVLIAFVFFGLMWVLVDLLEKA